MQAVSSLFISLLSGSRLSHTQPSSLAQVLVTAPSNIAVDQLATKIALTGVKVVRLCSKTREEAGGQGEELCLHDMVLKTAPPEFLKLQALLDEMGELKNRDEKKYRQLKTKIELKILASADVICTTCVMAADHRIKSSRFSKVILDEATQAVEPEALIPITRGCKQLILVGAHMQLPPVVMNKKAQRKGLTTSLFERLIYVGVKPTLLKVQYRMHPCISAFPSNMFYNGVLENGVTAIDRTPSKEVRARISTSLLPFQTPSLTS